MITRQMKIRRQLRSARVAALTPEERRDELRAAERRISPHDDRPDPDTGDSDPRTRTPVP